LLRCCYDAKRKGSAIFEDKGFERLHKWYGGSPETTKYIVEFLGPDPEDKAMEMLGIDYLSIRPRYIDPVLSKREYRKNTVFIGRKDENEILATGTEKEVRERTKGIIGILGHDGRYIVPASHDYVLLEITAVNNYAMFDELRKCSKHYWKDSKREKHRCINN
jgi:hypothetical protein